MTSLVFFLFRQSQLEKMTSDLFENVGDEQREKETPASSKVSSVSLLLAATPSALPAVWTVPVSPVISHQIHWLIKEALTLFKELINSCLLRKTQHQLVGDFTYSCVCFSAAGGKPPGASLSSRPELLTQQSADH